MFKHYLLPILLWLVTFKNFIPSANIIMTGYVWKHYLVPILLWLVTIFENFIYCQYYYDWLQHLNIFHTGNSIIIGYNIWKLYLLPILYDWLQYLKTLPSPVDEKNYQHDNYQQHSKGDNHYKDES